MKNWARLLTLLPLGFLVACATDGAAPSNTKNAAAAKETRPAVRETPSHTYVPRFTALKDKKLKIAILDKREARDKDNTQVIQLREQAEEILVSGGFKIEKDAKTKLALMLIEDDEKDFCLKLQGQLKSDQLNLFGEATACSSISSASGQLVASHSPPALNVALNNLLKILDQKSDEVGRSSKVSNDNGSL